jgi:acetyl-CoA carboxylase carboxyltransferase component
LGGATTHTEISGVCDYNVENDQECLKTIRDLMDKIGKPEDAGFDRKESIEPKEDPKNLYGILPADRNKQYDMKNIIRCIVDNSEFTEYKSDYGKSIICAYARVDGWSVGIVANQREVVKNAKGEMQFGGVIYSDSADKAARFIMNCNQKNIPLIFLHDVSGFMVGSKSEHGGIIKDGAKMVNAMANSVVPKFSIVMGNSYGAGNYAMCGKAYDPRLIVGWPTAEIAVMGGQGAVNILFRDKIKAAEEAGEDVAAVRAKLAAEYTYSVASPFLAAERGELDGIIEPSATRISVIKALRALRTKRSNLPPKKHGNIPL